MKFRWILAASFPALVSGMLIWDPPPSEAGVRVRVRAGGVRVGVSSRPLGTRVRVHPGPGAFLPAYGPRLLPAPVYPAPVYSAPIPGDPMYGAPYYGGYPYGTTVAPGTVIAPDGSVPSLTSPVPSGIPSGPTTAPDTLIPTPDPVN